MADKKFIPAISIIIPMYNAEKYIGECLDSIFAQTFNDYEVIIVDDCSTDNSCKIVEDYMKTRGTAGNIRLIRRKFNSGSGGEPRNDGIKNSRGEYVMFVDSDDAITNTACEEIYSAAKKFDADVVHCEKCYRTQGENTTTDKRFLQEFAPLGNLPIEDFVTEPAFMPNDLVERLKIFLARKFDWSTCQNFIRRDFILQHGIRFPDYKVQEDTIFAFYLLCLTDKILRVPNIFYVYRYRSDSACRYYSMPFDERMRRWISAFFKSISLLENFMNGIDLFKNHVDYKYAVFDAIFKFIAFEPCTLLYGQIPAHQLDEIIRSELEKVESTTALTAFLFSRMSVLNINLMHLQQQLQAKLNTKVQ